MNTKDAAALAGYTNVAAFTKAMQRERKRPGGVDCLLPEDQWIDGRTPLWDARKIKTWARWHGPRREQ